ncbi:MAG: pirin family protein [Candidatus Paceibacterota bacterium]
MKKVIDRSGDRGRGEYGWLTTRYSFSFADWHEPTRMGFGALRVINDDVISASSGFGMHHHQDMEIITIVTYGTVTHKDSMGNIGIVPAGDVQVMSAGTGVTHSEYNDSKEEALSLFQIWIQPKEFGIEPHYAQSSFNLAEVKNGLTLLVAPIGVGSGLPINQDAYISYAVLDKNIPCTYNLKEKGNGVYLFVVEGKVTLDGEILHSRDAMAVSGTDEMTITSSISAKVLIIEVPL